MITLCNIVKYHLSLHKLFPWNSREGYVINFIITHPSPLLCVFDLLHGNRSMGQRARHQPSVTLALPSEEVDSSSDEVTPIQQFTEPVGPIHIMISSMDELAEELMLTLQFCTRASSKI